MIIAAYAGTGKSTFAAQTEDTVDLPIMPYRWILPPIEKTPAELEGEKGVLYRLSNPGFPQNYLAEILRAEGLHRFVLIPTDAEVIRHLQKDYGRKVLLCYPNDACREEYRARFIARGNSESFLELFIDNWDRFLRPIKENKQGVHIIMGPGQHLMDLRQRFEEGRCSDMSVPVSEEAIRTLEEKTAGRRKNLVLYLFGAADSCFYSITNLDAPEEREFLHQIGKMAFDSGIGSAVMPMDHVWKGVPDAHLTGDHGVVKAFVEKHGRIL